MTTVGVLFTVLAVAATPVIERGALPLALNVFDLPPFLAFSLVIIGNILPAFVIIYAFDPIMHWLGAHIPAVHRFGERAIEHVRKKVHPWVEKYGVLGLIIVVAVPTPLTGSWTGSGGAAILGMDKRKAVWCVIIGVVIANLIILGADLGLLKAVTWYQAR